MHKHIYTEREQSSEVFVVARMVGRWRVTLVNPSGNDVNHTQTNSITAVQMSPWAWETPNTKNREENTAIMMERWYLGTVGVGVHRRLHIMQDMM